ncbi:hypothetical protein FNYG_08910 [Fusarium nygamai]|uniref:Uncharacterized protein n=1 Tax=Gibberella nygamai TaxID=42673 RepID=A0A2K0W6D1_GIBNY|nr:hypothetical protein FNYG_08910 [Fusarium nygamai]
MTDVRDTLTHRLRPDGEKLACEKIKHFMIRANKLSEGDIMDILTGLEGDLVTMLEIPVGPPCTQEDEHKPEKRTLKEQYYE